MTTPWFEGDDQLLEELGQALAQDGPNPEQVEMLMAGYDIVMADTLEAALIHDSASDELAAVRSETADARMLAFADDEIEFEFEFELVAGRVVGHIDPPQPGTIYLEQPTMSGPTVDEATPDDLGAFEFPLRDSGTFRLRFVGADGQSVATGWIDGPHQTLS